MQRTFTVTHPGRTTAPERDMLYSLRVVLEREGLVLVGDPKVLASENTGGVSTKYTVEFESRKSKPGDDTEDDTAPDDGE